MPQTPSSSRQAPHQPEDRSPSPIVALSVTTTPSKLVKIARQFELEKNTARAEAQELRRKLADITNQEDEGNAEAPPSKRSRKDDSEEPDVETQVIGAGHLFVMLYSPWLRLGEATFKVEYDAEADEAERFENGVNKVQGQVHEIIRILGTRLASEMSSETWIAKAFLKGMKAQRSNTATRLRRHSAGLFGISESDILRSEVRKEKFRARIGWVENGLGSGSYSTVDVEILHKDYTGSYNFKTAFLNPILMWVFVAIIRGPTAAKELMNGIESNPKTDTMARKHGIRHTTPGAIAGTVVLCRWALSSDEFLQNVGTNTGINYGKDFEAYLETLVTGLRKKKCSVVEIFRQWDRVVFPNSDSSLVRQDQDASGSGLQTMMTGLDEDVEEDSEDSD